MPFLPIVERELRAGARRRSTYRIRRWTALFGIACSFCFLAVSGSATAGSGPGRVLFTILTTYAAGLCLVAAVLFSSDALSSEKREGTIGLLFLTELKGYDLVLGKFIGIALTTFYGLLALFPIAAVPLMIGGLTGGEFWRSSLALLNGLFVSVAVSLWVSAVGRDSRNTLSGSVAMLLFIIAGLPALDKLAYLAWGKVTWFTLASPYYSFRFARDPVYGLKTAHYWKSLGVSHLVGWVFLGLASFMLVRFWRDKGEEAFRKTGIFQFRSTPVRRRKALLDTNPIAWVMGDERVLKWLIWGIIFCYGIYAAMQTAGMFGTINPLQGYSGPKVAGFLLKLLFATQVCRFFVESRRNGALELLVCTPLRSSEIIRGQWQALARLFLAPFVAFLLLNFAPLAFTVYRAAKGPGFAEFLAAGLGIGAAIGMNGWFAFHTLADVCALGWFGMWLALTTKRPNLATPMTILFVLILPSLMCFFDIIADLIFILWGLTRLQQDFRWVLERQYGGYWRGPRTDALE
ncbi:MAG TPA: ABC transporter permease subunit [Candidatus Dormibacteraeota bacterium]|nr:ABC transporter permease subunit [Candidatus Dormibacteraeota bacterium]